MGKLWNALQNRMRGKRDEAAEALANPAEDAKFAIEDSEKQIGGMESKVAKFMASNKRQERELADAKADVKKWNGIAEGAVSAGNEADALTALEKVTAAEERVTTLKAQTKANNTQIEGLRAQLTKARAKVSAAKSDHARLTAQLEGAKVRKELAAASSEFGTGDSPLSRLDDLKKKVDEQETEAEAAEELSGGGDEDLAAKYAPGSTSAQDKLAAMKAKLAEK
jgi:phage shock protein A